MKGAPDAFCRLTLPFQPAFQGRSPPRKALREISQKHVRMEQDSKQHRYCILKVTKTRMSF